MGLKEEFNNEIQILLSSKVAIGEVNLFRSLMKAYRNFGGVCNEYHGRKGFVTFTLIPPSGLPISKTCEISDLLFVFIGESQIRYTFMQNKYSIDKCDCSIKKVNVVQHYLLSKRPTVSSAPAGLPLDILSSATLPSVGSYGDFFKETTDTKITYDMKFMIANLLIPQWAIKTDTPYKRGYSRKYLDSLCTDDAIVVQNGLPISNRTVECPFCSNLNEFERKGNKLLIGSPIEGILSDIGKKIIGIAKYVLTSNENGGGLLSKLSRFYPDSNNIKPDSSATFSVEVVDCAHD